MDANDLFVVDMAVGVSPHASVIVLRQREPMHWQTHTFRLVCSATASVALQSVSITQQGASHVLFERACAATKRAPAIVSIIALNPHEAPHASLAPLRESIILRFDRSINQLSCVHPTHGWVRVMVGASKTPLPRLADTTCNTTCKTALPLALQKVSSTSQVFRRCPVIVGAQAIPRHIHAIQFDEHPPPAPILSTTYTLAGRMRLRVPLTFSTGLYIYNIEVHVESEPETVRCLWDSWQGGAIVDVDTGSVVGTLQRRSLGATPRSLQVRQDRGTPIAFDKSKRTTLHAEMWFGQTQGGATRPLSLHTLKPMVAQVNGTTLTTAQLFG